MIGRAGFREGFTRRPWHALSHSYSTHLVVAAVLFQPDQGTVTANTQQMNPKQRKLHTWWLRQAVSNRTKAQPQPTPNR